MPVVATKLHVPTPRPDLVVRPRLQEQLLAATSGPTRLVLVCAPAGFGKTTVVSQWLATVVSASPPWRVAWVSLDGQDDDVRRFLGHVVAALRTTDPAVGQEALALLDSGDQVPTEVVLTSLVNDLDVVAGPTVLALDDLHEVTAPAVHQALGFLLDHLPAHVRLAVTSRSDPPLPLARLRSNGALVELRAADLRFTAEEADVLLNQEMGLGVPPQAVAALDERTEGWAAGLQLAGLSLRGRDDATAFVEDFTGSHRFVLDYLVEEVLGRQGDDVRDFLLRTSVLRSMTASLCEAVTGRADAQQVLERLERDNLFVVPLDDHREWYRYHRLFSDVLQGRLRSGHADELAGLHAEAGRWYAQHGLLSDAITHAQAGGDVERAADLVELDLPRLRRERRDDTLRRLVRSLPDDVLRARPLLATAMAWSHLALGDLDGVQGWLDVADAAAGPRPELPRELRESLPVEADLLDQDVREVPAMTEVYRAAVAQARGDVRGTIAHAGRALELAGPDDHATRGAASGFLGLAAWGSGDLTTAVDTFGEAVASMRAAGLVADELGSTVVLAGMWLARGRPDEARRLLERALEAAERHPVPLSTTGDLHVGLADVLREEGNLGGAWSHLAAARELGDAASLPENRHRWFTTAAGVLRARGDLDAALDMVSRAATAYQPGFFPAVRPISAVAARLQIARGDLAAADAWARETGVAVGDPPTYLTEFDQLTLARLVLAEAGRSAEGDLEPVVRMLDAVVDAAASAGRVGSVIEARLVRGLVHAAAGSPEAAASDLAEAVTAGVPVGYRRLFLDEGGPARELLTALVTQRPDDEAAACARTILDTVPAETAQPPVAAAAALTVDETLSDRELQVLRLLATDLTGPAIARELFVSVNTLRTHTKHVFTKLGVNSRRSAVSRATELGLL